ncbi:MAG: NAD(P)-binding protein, partial [Gallionellaceae bacterium]|nr:NAD(P)-binding protein [Gallionellaceae bacterium]
MSNIVIIGAGSAGMSCALWLDNSGHEPVVLEQASQCGGMLCCNPHRNDWLLG